MKNCNFLPIIKCLLYKFIVQLCLALYGPLTGGWVAADDDTDPYIVVNMEAPYIFSKIHLQGQQDEPNWVEAYRVYYSDDGGIWTLYHDANSEFVSFIYPGTYYLTTVREMDIIVNFIG